MAQLRSRAAGLAVLLLAATALAGPAAAQVREAAGMLPDGSRYLMRIPETWNGVLINDLDYVTSAEGARAKYLMSKGYALSGLARHPDRDDIYDPAVEIANLVTVIDMFKARFGAPRRVIEYGQSGGGNVALGIGELHPERVDGVVAGCATTPVLTSGARYDVMTALAAVVAPGDPGLMISNVPKDSDAAVARWTQVMTAAGTTPQGRARIALALTLTQWPDWTIADTPRPDPRDAHALAEAMARTAAGLPRSDLPSQYMYERHGGLTHTAGADYAAYWANADPVHVAAVRSLYAEAGLDLDADLTRIQAAPRIPADPKADDFWQNNQARTTRGLPQVPVFRFHTIGDGTTMVAQTRVYSDLVARNGKGDLFRVAYVERTGHCNFTVAESAAGIETVMRRLDTGKWDDVTPAALNARGRALATGTEPRFIDFSPGPFNGVWRLRPH